MLRVCFLTSLAMLAFAGNSLLCRLALKGGHIDPMSFTLLRLASGACMLAALAYFGAARPGRQRRPTGTWFGAFSLCGYAVAFSLAYVGMDAGPGALVLFAAVQLSMLAYGLATGERLGIVATGGLALSLGGLAFLLLPGSSAPPVGSAALMVAAGMAWGAYTLHGRRVASPLAATAGNFLRATLIAGALLLPFVPVLEWSGTGVVYALVSGAVASGLGYVIWYGVLRDLMVTQASIVQLSVPVISVLAGIPLLHEPLTPRVALSCLGVLGGMAIVLLARRRPGPGRRARARTR